MRTMKVDGYRHHNGSNTIYIYISVYIYIYANASEIAWLPTPLVPLMSPPSASPAIITSSGVLSLHHFRRVYNTLRGQTQLSRVKRLYTFQTFKPSYLQLFWTFDHPNLRTFEHLTIQRFKYWTSEPSNIQIFKLTRGAVLAPPAETPWICWPPANVSRFNVRRNDSEATHEKQRKAG